MSAWTIVALLLVMPPRWFLSLVLAWDRLPQAVPDEAYPFLDALQRRNERVEVFHETTPD
jgi:hypothetical protein